MIMLTCIKIVITKKRLDKLLLVVAVVDGPKNCANTCK